MRLKFATTKGRLSAALPCSPLFICSGDYLRWAGAPISGMAVACPGL